MSAITCADGPPTALSSTMMLLSASSAAYMISDPSATPVTAGNGRMPLLDDPTFGVEMNTSPTSAVLPSIAMMTAPVPWVASVELTLGAVSDPPATLAYTSPVTFVPPSFAPDTRVHAPGLALGPVIVAPVPRTTTGQTRSWPFEIVGKFTLLEPVPKLAVVEASATVAGTAPPC